MRFDKRTKILGLAGIAAVAIGVGVGSTVPTQMVSAGQGDPKLASLMQARSPGMRTSAAVSTKNPIVQPAVFKPTMAPAPQVLGERTPAAVAVPAQAAPPLAPAVLAPPPGSPIAPAVAAAAVPAVVVPAAAVAAGGGGSALAGLAALPIIPAVLGGGGGGGVSVSAAPAVPEPATWLMMIAGFAVIGSALRRRRRREQVEGTAPSRDMNSLARTA
jgi:hypothetical protein